MIEAFIPIIVGTVTGLGVLFNKLHNRVHDLDKRIDTFELRIAESYVSKTDLNDALERFETHMLRIENKLDKIILK